MRQCLIDLGHPQPPTPINTDNATAHGILNNTMKQKKSKAMDMRFHWVRNRINQGQLIVRWRPGKSNLADYPTKHHTGLHHKTLRPIYLYDEERSPRTVQGCIKILEGNSNPCINSAKYVASSVGTNKSKYTNNNTRPGTTTNKRVTWKENLTSICGETSMVIPRPLNKPTMTPVTRQGNIHSSAINFIKSLRNQSKRIISSL